MIMPTRYWMPTTLWSSVNLKYLARPGSGAVCGSSTGTGLADHLSRQGVEHAEPGQPAHDHDRVAERDRHVAGVVQGERVEGVADRIAEEVADGVADHGPDAPGGNPGAHRTVPRPPRVGRAARALPLLRLYLDGHPSPLRQSVCRSVPAGAGA